MDHMKADGRPGLACGPRFANSCSPGMVQGSAASLSPSNLLEMKMYGHHRIRIFREKSQESAF